MVIVNLAGGRTREIDSRDFVQSLSALRETVAAPYSPARLDLVASVGAAILRGKAGQTSPAVVHFAYWTRSAALKRLAETFRAGQPAGCQSRPVGLVFHLPPQNVETVFLYSWVLSYLAGNANIVRLPSALGDEMRGLLDLFLAAFESRREEGQLFVNYPADSDASVEISGVADARVVWGGDAKIAAFAGVPLRNGGKSIWFGDRFSLSVVDGETLAALDPGARADLAQRLCNDIYVFEQMACSSPHVLYVVGDRGRHGSAVRALFDATVAAAKTKGLEPATGHAIHKMVEGFASAGRGDAQELYWRENALTAAETPVSDAERRVGGGYLEYRYLKRLSDLTAQIRPHHQTLTYFGFGSDMMAEFAAARVTEGLTRIVPFGQALDFDFIWDGYDLPRELTRLVRIL